MYKYLQYIFYNGKNISIKIYLMGRLSDGFKLCVLCIDNIFGSTKLPFIKKVFIS